jgi:hypothetical protein
MSIEVKGSQIRARIVNPKVFKKDKFRTIPFSEEKCINAVIGVSKHSSHTKVQSLRFCTKDWTIPEVKKWLSIHKYKVVK